MLNFDVSSIFLFFKLNSQKNTDKSSNFNGRSHGVMTVVCRIHTTRMTSERLCTNQPIRKSEFAFRRGFGSKADLQLPKWCAVEWKNHARCVC